ncbi:MAG: hypothetical protein KA807_03340 [Prolixibacteraceae bacterium]|nr:hypothetical protein [Prolixibacteraceae bacterium]
MRDKILQLLTDGDFYLKEAKSKFLMRQDEDQSDAARSCSKAIKRYLEAYKCFLTSRFIYTTNFHIMVREILQYDPEFMKFYDRIFKIKCFAEESKRYNEDFFLYDDEVNSSIDAALDIRSYVSQKIHNEHPFLSEFIGTSFMAI